MALLLLLPKRVAAHAVSGSAEQIASAANASLVACVASYDASSFPRVLATISYTKAVTRSRKLASTDLDALATAAAEFVISDMTPALSPWEVAPQATEFQVLDDYAGTLKVFLLVDCYVDATSHADVGSAMEKTGFRSAVEGAVPGYTLGTVAVLVDTSVGAQSFCHSQTDLASLHEEVALLQTLQEDLVPLDAMAQSVSHPLSLEVTVGPTTATSAVPIPAPPSPPVYGLEVALVVAGEVSDYDATDIASFTSKMDAALGVTGGVTTVSAASVIFVYSVTGLSAAEAASASAALGPIVATAQTASSFFGVSVEMILAPPSSPPPPSSAPETASPPPSELSVLDEPREDALTSLDEAETAGLSVGVVLIALPLFCILYVLLRYGPTKACLWFKYRGSHSNPKVRWFYVPNEQRLLMQRELHGTNFHKFPEAQSSSEFARTETDLGAKVGPSGPAAIATPRTAENNAFVAEVQAEIDSIRKNAAMKSAAV